MLEINKARQAALDKLLKLRYPAIALKLAEREEDVPAGAERPEADWGKHIALCQAFAYARRQNKIICLRKEDQWCWTPLMCYGMCDGSKDSLAFKEKVKYIGITDPKKSEAFVSTLPHLPRDKYFAIVMAPLDRADFAPDLILTYSSNAQLRLMLMAVFSQSGTMVNSGFIPLESCIYSVIPPIEEGEYRITLPDPGEFERAFTGDDEIIFSVPAQKMDEFFAGVDYQLSLGRNVNSYYPTMKEDFSRPPFYNRVFESWGMATGELWDKKEGTTVKAEE